MTPANTLVVRTLNQASALLDETRLRLISELAAAPSRGDPGLSAAGLSRRLAIPRQLVNYHLRVLEIAGLVTPVSEKRRGSATTRVLAATATTFALDPALLGTVGSQSNPSGETTPPPEHPTSTLASIELAFATDEDRAAFVEDASAELQRLAREYEHPAGRVRARVDLYPLP
jgi:DNA-binding transcriptional ArsR family regulator